MHIGSFENEFDPVSPKSPRDLADFHLRWSEFRPRMLALQSLSGLTPQQTETLGWLIILSDRVGDEDFS